MTDSAPTPETLRRKHEAQWDPEEPYGPLALRTYRAISWVRAAREPGTDNPDVTFILYWIAFNAAYAKGLSKKLAEDEFEDYFERLLLLDHRTICLAIQRHFPEVICRFLENEYAFKVYWKHQNGEVEDAVWEHEFAEEWKRLEKALQRPTKKNTTTVLTTLFGRLYTLRNQLVHGGSTWKGSLNRDSVRDGARIMEILVPIFIEVMIDNPKEDWGPPHYLARPNLRERKTEEEPANGDSSGEGEPPAEVAPTPTMTDSAPTPGRLRARHEALWPQGKVFEPLPLRTWRALRWWERAERENEAGDLDVAFLLYWTAFNAAYAREVAWKPAGDGERADFEDYFATLLTLDRRSTIYEATFDNYYGPISAILDNEYLFSPFWKHADGRPGYSEWRKWFEGVKGLVRRAIAEQNTSRVLNFLFDRLYTLRNQLVHGGATWDSSLNRPSLQHGVRVLRLLLPRFLEVMLDHPEEEWDPPYYRAFPEPGGKKAGKSPPAGPGAGESAALVDELARRHEAQWDRDEPLTPFALRMQRAISWAQRAGWEREDGDLDVAFVLWWISFNAAYAKDLDRDLKARDEIGVFLGKLLYLDRSHAIHEAIRGDFSGAVGELLENRYLFQPFWDDANGKRRGWTTAFEQTGNEAREALDAGDTGTVLAIVFERLYTLRKQLVHGGATWDSSLNRDSVREGARILEFLVPAFIGIMLDNPRDEWGPPHYFPGPHAREERGRR